MAKIGRNELCPCGSGKKYKKCCGQHNTQEFNADAVNNELYSVHGELISFTNTDYDNVIDQQIALYEHDEEINDVFKTGLKPWIVTKKSLLPDGKSIFQAYINQKRSEISLPARQTLLLWMEQEPSIYQVIAIDQQKTGFATIQNIAGKKELHLIPYDDESNFPVGELIIGIIVPFLEHDNFLFSMIRLFSKNKLQFQKLSLAHNNYPALFNDVLKHGLFRDRWLQPQHEEVADLFATYASEKGHTNKVIADGIFLWNEYCEKVNPAIQKPGPHAAAFTYYYEKDVLENANVRQLEVAEQFGTSASSLSATYRRIAKELNN